MMEASGSAVAGLRSEPTSPAGKRVASNRRAQLFLALALTGLLGQVALFAAFLAGNGFAPGEFADQVFASTVAALSFADLASCFVVFLVWLPREAARVGIRRWWPFALATFGGLCFALPLFLSVRERTLEARANAA
jgi:membrane protease YdiL (CAAX protease family)